MKNVLLVILGLIILASGTFFVLNSKSQATEDTNKKVLVAYFSVTGNTKQVAQHLANAINADIYEIKPKVLYTKEDLDWTNENSRTSVEKNAPNFRPEMSEDDFSPSNYHTIFLGFPIWWGKAPTIVNTFLENYDFSDKKIILFATSGGSGLGGAVEHLKKSVSNSTEIKEGKLFNNHPTKDELKKWADSIL